MKKFFSLAFLTLLLSCSNEGFKEPKSSDVASWAGLDSLNMSIVTCFVGESCHEISKSACDIIGGKQPENENDKCIHFTCKWQRSKVKYGEESTLKFDLDSTGQEDCSWEISYGNVLLHPDTSYTISPATFSGLSYSKKTDIVAKATVTCRGQKVDGDCEKLEVDSVPTPKFTCEWYPKEIKYGGKAALNYDFDNKGHKDCSLQASYGNVPLLFDTSYTISSSTFSGLSYSKETDIVAKATVTCKDQVSLSVDCTALKVTPIPGPTTAGTIAFKKNDYVSNDSNFFFIGTRIDSTYIDNTMSITNKNEAECGNIKIKIDGSPARLNTSVKATAVVYCTYTDTLELASTSAEVLPDPVIKECTLGNNSQYYMHRGESLTLNVTLDDISGRCNNGIRYSLNGTTYSTSLSLSSSSGKLSSIKARAECSGNLTTPSVSCPEIFVAEGYIGNARCNHQSIFEANINVTKATTVIEYACCEPKNDYFITCDGSKSYNFKIQGAPDVTSSNGDANLPDLTPIPESNTQCTEYGDSPGGTLYRYPKRILMTVTSGLGGGFSCDSW